MKGPQAWIEVVKYYMCNILRYVTYFCSFVMLGFKSLISPKGIDRLYILVIQGNLKEENGKGVTTTPDLG